MKFLASLALATAALAAPQPFAKRQASSPLDIQIAMDGNSKVKAILTNNGDADLRLLKTGTFLDQAPVEKAKVYSGVKSKQAVRFQGVRLRVATSKLDPSAFQTLAAGQSLSAEFDLAHLHDLSPGGAYDVELSGALSSSDASSTSLTGSVPYHSNRLRITVDGAAAAQAAASFHLARRTKLQDCTGSQLNVTQTALGHCARIAAAAKRAALTDGKRMTEYFKSDANATRSEVAAVFDKIADECGSTDSGVSEYYCSDPYGGCSGGVLAYTVPARSYMAYCPLYFRELPALTQTCHDQDQATTNLHEMTHLREIKGTEDYGGYGYEFVRGLTAEQNINHADTYTMFANAVALDC